MIIAIDGPSGSGKTTLGRMLAHALKLLYIDTGSMYRTVALAVIEARLRKTNYKDHTWFVDYRRLRIVAIKEEGEKGGKGEGEWRQP